MAFYLEKFGTTLLPIAGGSQELHSLKAQTLTRTLPYGGVLDYVAASSTIPFSSTTDIYEYAESRTGFGSRKLKASGLVIPTSSETLTERINKLVAMRGKRDTLTRLWDDGTTRHTIDARLLDVKLSRQINNRDLVPVTMEFLLMADHWDGDLVTYTDNQSTAGGNAISDRVTHTNAGTATVTDAIIQIDINPSGAGTWMTLFNINSFSQSVFTRLSWSGYQASGASKIIDSGTILINALTKSITLDGVGDYESITQHSNFLLHPKDEWFSIPAGGTGYDYLFGAALGGFLEIDLTVTYNEAWL